MKQALQTHVNFSSHIIGFFKKEYALAFNQLLERINQSYYIDVKEETKHWHLEVVLRCSEMVAIGIAKKIVYFNHGKNSALSVMIVIPSQELIHWGVKLRKGQSADNYMAKLSKNVLVESIDYQAFDSLDEYFEFCCDRIFECLIANKLIIAYQKDS